MRKFGIIAAVLALSIGTWFFMKKTSPVQDAPIQTSDSPEPASPAQDANPEGEVAQGGATHSETAPAAPSAPATSESSDTSSAPVVVAPAQSPAKTVTPDSAKPPVSPTLNASATAPVRSQSEPAKKEAVKNCFTYEYRHHESAKTKDIESFLDFSNAFPIAAENVNKKSICVKVNQKPVEFQVLKLKGKEEIVIGPVVGPESVIRVSYCTGQAQCREACIPQKKRFMDDLLSDAHADDFQDSWGAAGADANSKELKAKSKELQTLAKTNGALNDRAMMRDWNTLQKQEWSCNQK